MKNYFYLPFLVWILLANFCMTQTDTIHFKLCEEMLGKKKDINWTAFFICDGDTIIMKKSASNIYFFSFNPKKFFERKQNESPNFLIFISKRYFYEVRFSFENFLSLDEFCIEPGVNKLNESSFYYRKGHIYASGLVLRRKRRR